MVFSKFTSLSVRPPTPPKDLHNDQADADETLQFLQDPFGDTPAPPKAVIVTKTLVSTPEQSPSSDISIPSSAASRQKRVNFELQTCPVPLKPATAQPWTPSRSSPLRPLPQTRISKPLKSILKPSDATSTPPPAEPSAAAHNFKSFAEMLESIVKLLASPERPSRMDAYHSLHRTMQAYEKVPDDQALRQKMSLLAQFIRRDVVAPSPTGVGLDSQLVAQALKLLMALFRITDVASIMDDDFCSFILERTIQVATDPLMPKAIVNTHLAALMQQTFRLKIMTTARVERILDMLDTITDRVGGYSVQAYRIRIYRKLIQQRPDVMIKHTERWFKYTIKAFMSGQKDINQSALDIAISAAKTIGHDRQVARSCLAVLNRVRSDGESIARVMTKELEKMLNGDNASLVPQIWSAVTLLLRDSLHGHLFSALKEWLEVFEKCLVSDKESVRVQTNVAFCFLLYAVNLSQHTSEGWTRMFVKIPLHQLQRRVPAKKAERDAVSSGYLTLLYYAFRPAAPQEQFDRYWREFVASFWTPLVVSPSSPHAFAACRIVSALLKGSRKPWNEQRTLDQRPQCMIQRVELPLLDPKWVRKSIASVLEFVETLLDIAPWSGNDQQEDEPTRSMWLAVLDSLVEASSKEVMASTETKDAMAHIVNFLRRIWDKHTAELAVQQKKEELWASKFCFLIETVVQKLGAFQFSDKCLIRNATDDFEVASTPSQRSRLNGSRISPLLYFVDLLVNKSEGKLPDDVRLRAIKITMEPCFQAQNTRLGRLQLLRDCSSTAGRSLEAAAVASFWDYTVSLLQCSLQEQSSDPNERTVRPLGTEYESVIEILGSAFSYLSTSPRGHEVLIAFIDVVRREAGEGAIILAVIERVAECVLNRTSQEDKKSGLLYISILLQHLPKQPTRRSIEHGRQILWPSSPAVGRHVDFDPYNNLYAAISSAGSSAYEKMEYDDIEATKSFLEALAASIRDCSASQLAVYLRKTQNVLKLWIEDSKQKLHSSSKLTRLLHHETINLSKAVNMAIERLPRNDSQILLHLEPLITAGFVSRRRAIVSMSAATWNNTFGKEESLRYPPHLEQALRRLCRFVDLKLPSLEIQAEDEAPEPLFYDSDDGLEDLQQLCKSPRVKISPFKVSKSTRRSSTRSPAVSTPGSRRASARKTSKVRLRHDDSQIQFEPIVSSPSNPFRQESQILTERQKEIIERQRIAGGLFADMGDPSLHEDTLQSPMEIHSDLPTTDDLPKRQSWATPSKSLANLDPMDAFPGSSPTPHARRNTRQSGYDNTSVITPTTVRTAALIVNDEITSSPPQLRKLAEADTKNANDYSKVESSFECRQRGNFEAAIVEGTTIDDGMSLPTESENIDGGNSFATNLTDTIMSELPSSTIDLQLTAQLDADIQAHVAATASEAPDTVSPSGLESADAAPALRPLINDERDDDNTKEPDSQLVPFMSQDSSSRTKASNSVSHVGDLSSKLGSSTGTPGSHSLRRSSRHSATPSPVQVYEKKKRKRTSTKPQSPVHNQQESVAETPRNEPTARDEDDMFDNIIVISPAPKQKSGKKRKSMNSSEMLGANEAAIPETSRKRGPVRRSQSLLSQVENSQDILVEDTPATKRARQGTIRDVSEAKTTSPPLQETHVKRMSHVQVTPKRSSELGSSTRNSPLAIETASLSPGSRGVLQNHGRAAQESNHNAPSARAATPSRSFTERVILTPRSIINQLKSLKDYLFNAPQLVLGREEEREIDDALFHIRRQVCAAGLRGEEQMHNDERV